MASFLQRTFLVALILMITTTTSKAHRKRYHYGDTDESDIEQYLQDLCSDTKEEMQCWKILQTEINRFSDTDSKSVAGVVIDLAIYKSNEISNKLSQLHEDSEDDVLKEKYASCSKNYEGASRNLGSVKSNIESGDNCELVQTEIKDAEKEQRSCNHEFQKESFDPEHIRIRVKEFDRYLDIVKAAVNRVIEANDGGEWDTHSN